MNYSLYLFGTNGGTYLQYPFDGEEAFLRPLCASVKGTQLTVHRKDALTHYAFFRQLTSDSSQIFGICLVTNGLYIKDIRVLYQTFDKLLFYIALNGDIIRLEGMWKNSYISDNFVFDTKVYKQAEEIVRKLVKEDLEQCTEHIQHNFSGIIAAKTIELKESNSELLNAIDRYNIVHIYSKNDENPYINGVKQSISFLNIESIVILLIFLGMIVGIIMAFLFN